MVKTADCMLHVVYHNANKQAIMRAEIPSQAFSLTALESPTSLPQKPPTSPRKHFPNEGLFIQWVTGESSKRPISEKVNFPQI